MFAVTVFGSTAASCALSGQARPEGDGAFGEKTPARGNHGGGECADRSDERPTGCCGAGRAREDATDSARFHDREVRP